MKYKIWQIKKIEGTENRIVDLDPKQDASDSLVVFPDGVIASMMVGEEGRVEFWAMNPELFEVEIIDD